MKPKILITGPPRCGKSTLISRLISYYSKINFNIEGFLTPEVREKNNRIGFDAVDIKSKQKIQLARTGNYKTQFKLGRYHIFIKEFENFIENLETIDNRKVDLIIIDEIGKMELFSKKFQEIIKKLFDSEISIIATIGQKIYHPIKNYILNVPGVTMLNLNRQKKELIFQKIISLL